MSRDTCPGCADAVRRTVLRRGDAGDGDMSVWLAAAELVETPGEVWDDEHRYACEAVKDAGGSAADMKSFAQSFKPADVHMCDPWFGPNWLDENAMPRVLALLFMHWMTRK